MALIIQPALIVVWTGLPHHTCSRKPTYY